METSRLLDPSKLKQKFKQFNCFNIEQELARLKNISEPIKIAKACPLLKPEISQQIPPKPTFMIQEALQQQIPSSLNSLQPILSSAQPQLIKVPLVEQLKPTESRGNVSILKIQEPSPLVQSISESTSSLPQAIQSQLLQPLQQGTPTLIEAVTKETVADNVLNIQSEEVSSNIASFSYPPSSFPQTDGPNLLQPPSEPITLKDVLYTESYQQPQYQLQQFQLPYQQQTYQQQSIQQPQQQFQQFNGQKYNPNNKNRRSEPFKEEPIKLVSPSRGSTERILMLNTLQSLLFVYKDKIVLQSIQTLHNSNSAVTIYTLPRHQIFTEGFVSENDIILLSTLSETDGETSGVVLVKLTDQVQNLQVQYLKNIENSKINSIHWDNTLGILLFSTESGNLHGFSTNLERLFFFEDPECKIILTIDFHADRDELLYGTSEGNLSIYNLATETSMQVLRVQGSIMKVAFVQGHQAILLASNTTQGGRIAMYSYPDMQVLSEWIFSSPINCLFVSEDKDEEKVVFAVAAAQNLQVYLIDKKKGKCKLYDKKLDSKPASLAVSTKLLYMNLIEVYYQNPSIVKEDRFVNDRCRYIIDSVISQQTSS